MITRWICISSTGEDWEAWFERPANDDPEGHVWFRGVCEYVKPLMVWDRQHPAAVETWPEYGETLREQYGWMT